MHRRFGLEKFTNEDAVEAVKFARSRYDFSIDFKTLRNKVNLALQMRERNRSLSFLKIVDQVLQDIPFNERPAYRSAIGKLWNERRNAAHQAAV